MKEIYLVWTKDEAEAATHRLLRHKIIRARGEINKNLAIANTSRVGGCAHDTSKTSIVTP